MASGLEGVLPAFGRAGAGTPPTPQAVPGLSLHWEGVVKTLSCASVEVVEGPQQGPWGRRTSRGGGIYHWRKPSILLPAFLGCPTPLAGALGTATKCLVVARPFPCAPCPVRLVSGGAGPHPALFLLGRYWDKEVSRAENDSQKPSLTKAIIKCYWKSYLILGIFTLVEVKVFTYNELLSCVRVASI